MRNIFSVLLIVLAVSCQGEPRKGGSEGLLTIPLESHWGDVDTLRASDYFSSVEYIPLETNDSCLVGAAPRFFFCRDTLVVAADQTRQGLAFSRSGKFFHAIGGEGRGPREYRSARSVVMNPYNATLYFLDMLPGKYHRFGMDGGYLSPLTFPSDSGVRVGYLAWLDAESPVGFEPNQSMWGRAPQLTFFDKEGALKHTVSRPIPIDSLMQSPSVNGNQLYITDGNLQIYMLLPQSGLLRHGIAGYGGVTTFNNQVTGGSYTTFSYEDAFFSYYDQQLFLREDFNDTIFQVTEEGLRPHVAFDFGKYHWPEESRYDAKRYGDSRSYISWFAETDRIIFFEFFTGGDTPMAYRGSYHKENQTVRLGSVKEGFYDDINGFMPLQILAKTYDDSFVGVLEPLKIRKWFEENPDKAAALPEHLKALRNISEEANPVVVVMRQKR